MEGEGDNAFITNSGSVAEYPQSSHDDVMISEVKLTLQKTKRLLEKWKKRAFDGCDLIL